MATVAHRLPDWRNFGVILRLVLGVNGAALAAALVQGGMGQWLQRYVALAAWVEGPLLCALVLLAGLRNPLWRLSLRLGQGAVVALAILLAAGQYRLGQGLWLVDGEPLGLLRVGLLAALLAIGLLGYFELRARAFSPAVTAARLAALNARIRPHFLFNSLNAVLSLIRSRPQEAEAALEALSDLFRAALRDPGDWVALSDEIALGRQYLELERLRLGDRLQVCWDVRAVPLDTPIPPLMLQPLLENAVYHGVEPAPAGGTVTIAFSRHRDELQIEIANPMVPGGGQHGLGNQMALANIRERLALYFDLEARLDIASTADRYLVRIVLPCRILPDRSPS